jgi:hypothetical protein
LTSTRLPETEDRPGSGSRGAFMAGVVRQKSSEPASMKKLYTKSDIYATKTSLR